MRKILLLAASALLASSLSLAAAAATPSVDSTVKWINPTVDTNGQALTAERAITKIQVFIASSPILDTSTIAPFSELVIGQSPAPGTQLVYTAPAGSTVYARVKACNQYACGVFSNQASKVLPFPGAAPAAPSGVDIVIVVTPPLAGAAFGTLAIEG